MPDATGIYDVAAALLALFEPDGAERDGALARPTRYELNGAAARSWAWPVSEDYGAVDTGGSDEEHFTVRVAYVVGASEEIAEGARFLATSQLLGDRVKTFRAALGAARTDASYEWAQISRIDWTLETLDGRGFLMDITGYRIQT